MRGMTKDLSGDTLFSCISIHIPHARDDAVRPRAKAANLFQSTSLMRGMTERNSREVRVIDISIHIPHARDDRIVKSDHKPDKISIHIPHARDDESGIFIRLFTTLFQSTSLMRGMTTDGSRRRAPV